MVKVFDHEGDASRHEKCLLDECQTKLKILMSDEKIIDMQPNDVLFIVSEYDDNGEPLEYEHLAGDKNKLIQHIALNSKYWYENNIRRRLIRVTTKF